MLIKQQKALNNKRFGTAGKQVGSGLSMSEFVPMHYKIVRDDPGRLRLRYGRDAFTAEEGYGMADALLRICGVDEVRTTPANGGVLVMYDEHETGCRANILSVLGTFDRFSLPSGKGTDEQRKSEIDMKFQRDAIKLVCNHLLRRFLVPAPLRYALAVGRSRKFISAGLKHLGRGELTVEVLDATAITASLLQGSYNSAGMVMMLLKFSDLLEEYTHARSRIALEQSLVLNMDDAWLVTDSGDVLVPMAQVREGDMIRVRTGAMIPVDGTVIEGEAAINESSMTGESQLAIKDADSTVFAGTVLEEGSIVIKVRNVGSDTRISRIVNLVDNSEKLKAGVQSKAERMADAIVPFSFLAFFGVLLGTRNMTKAMSVLMVDYSCAIKLSTPVAVMSAMREAANHGMVVKGGRYLEVMAEADTIVFDKTGTLTTATPKVEKVIPLGDMPESEVLRLSACLEEHFPHSMARAVVNAARERGITHDDEQHSEVKYIVAHGIASSVEGKDVVLGSGHYVFEDEGVSAPDNLREHIAEEAPGCSVIFLAVSKQLMGAICITDPLREEAVEAVSNLREAGFKNIVMLTGDAENAARTVARKLGITDYRSQVLPEDKANIVAEYKRRGHTVIMVGDGVNDSPALAVADASIAMVDASDIAREVADITLLHSSLDSILTLRAISKGLMSRINRNYRFIVGFNSALLVGGVAGLLQPTVSALLHNSSTMLITAGNMRPLLTESKEGEAHGRS